MNSELSSLQMHQWIELIQSQTVEWVPKMVAAATILIIGYFAAKLFRLFIAKGMRKAGLDETLIRFIRNIVYVLAIAFVSIAALGKLGVDTTSLAAIFAAAGLAIGLALQGSLGNFASGVLLIATRPFRVGDYVEVAGVGGAVEEINIFATVLNTPDNKKLIVPNGTVTSDVITNYSANSTRRLDMTFGIAYEDDVNQARQLIMEILEQHEKVLVHPKPTVALVELADSSVNFVVRPWVNTSDYWVVWADLTAQIKTAFERAGLNFPYPQQTVYLHTVTADA